MTVKYNRSIYEYDRILKSTMKRLGVEEKDYQSERDMKHGGMVQFTFKEVTWLYEWTVEMATKHGQDLKTGKEAWAQLTIGLQDLVRLYQRGIFDFTSGRVNGLKQLPAPSRLPEWVSVLEFNHMPSKSEMEERYKARLKVDHPDKGGTDQEFVKLQEAKKQADQYFEGK